MMRTYRIRQSGDQGVAMLTVVLVGFILTGMGLALAKTSIANLGNAGRDRVASGALGAAEAGVAGAITYLRGNGVRQICSTCTLEWNVLTAKTLTYGSGSAVVTIAEIQRYQPPLIRKGTYRIRSVGTTSGPNPGKRTVEQDIEIKPFDFPLGVYTAGKAVNNGNVSLQQISYFTGSCVAKRDGLNFIAGPGGTFIDPYNDIPSGAHSASYITDSNPNVCSSDLTSVRNSDVKAVHRSNNCHENPPVGPGDYWADQSALGGPYTTGTCAARTAGKGDYASVGSNFSLDVMKETYGFLPRGLTDDQYALLKAKAQAAGTWFPAGQAVTIPPASKIPGNPGYNPVIYVENQSINLGTQFNGYAWQDDPSCTDLHPSVLLVVVNGSVSFGSSTNYTGNLFVPDGQVNFGGGAKLVGTMFAKELAFSGNSQMGLNDCAASNTNGSILSVTKKNFREIDH